MLRKELDTIDAAEPEAVVSMTPGVEDETAVSNGTAKR